MLTDQILTCDILRLIARQEEDHVCNFFCFGKAALRHL